MRMFLIKIYRVIIVHLSFFIRYTKSKCFFGPKSLTSNWEDKIKNKKLPKKYHKNSIPESSKPYFLIYQFYLNCY